MQIRNASRPDKRRSRFEVFEQRLALSAQPLSAFGAELQLHEELSPVTPAPDFLLDVELEHFVDGDRAIVPHLSDSHQTTGVDVVHNTYGFGGAGQTVVIVDSGIAYDHVSLGGGFGAGNRVVGGYDFAENDADPYDDGPAGFHGTHVAGIVGSDHVTHRGVAPDVDLVALRVFDDDGAGFFSWVESALAWVHDNRNAFENPITTVNLSLGTTWNADTVPNWSTLEDELAQLEADGIFVAASAGNSFEDYNEVGLSYPAASPHVVPVASVDSDGTFSYFTQRHDRVLAAPGRTITSTVPDHVFGGDGNPNDFGAASGTSMASPYVAGASVLVRQAMEFVGVQSINQDTIYDHLRNTADVFVDNVTNASYHRINVQAALDALMPSDDYGSSVETAHSLGTLTDQASVNGLIGEITDVDYFSFTAGATGTVTMTVTGNHELVPNCVVIGATGTQNGNVLTFDVSAGETYTVSVETAAGHGIGFYDATLSLESTSTNLGSVEQQVISNQQLGGPQKWYELRASQSGVLTVEAFFKAADGNIAVQVYDAADQLLNTGISFGQDNERVDVDVNANESYFLRLIGTNPDVDLRLTNLIAESGNTLTISGRAGNDTVSVDANDMSVVVNGVSYTAAPTTGQINFAGGEGDDQIIFQGTSADDTATLAVGSVDVTSASYALSATSVERIDVQGSGGNDSATLSDSAGNDSLIAHGNASYSVLQGAGYYNVVRGFESVVVTASTGTDEVAYYDSSGNDVFTADAAAGYSSMQGTGFNNRANGFDVSRAHAKAGGADRAEFLDSTGNDRFIAHAAHAYGLMTGTGFHHVAYGFATMNAHSDAGGNDQANFFDSVNDDHLVSHMGDGYASMTGTGYTNWAGNFETVVANAGAGGTNDLAEFYDGSGNERFVAHANHGYRFMESTNAYHIAWGFDVATAHATGGGSNDKAEFYDSTGNDLFIAHAADGYSSMTGVGFSNTAHGFERTEAYAGAGGTLDRAEFYDSASNDRFVAYGAGKYAYMDGPGYYNFARGFDDVRAFGGTNGSQDRVDFFDSLGDDHLEIQTIGGQSSMTGTDYYHAAQGFSETHGHSIAGGTDRVTMRQLEDGGQLVGTGSMATYNGPSSQLVRAWKFETVEAEAEDGHDPSYEIGAVDFVFDEIGL